LLKTDTERALNDLAADIMIVATEMLHILATLRLPIDGYKTQLQNLCIRGIELTGEDEEK
jgi:hypothetical protein